MGSFIFNISTILPQNMEFLSTQEAVIELKVILQLQKYTCKEGAGRSRVVTCRSQFYHFMPNFI
jgi:hypothetical protein